MRRKPQNPWLVALLTAIFLIILAILILLFGTDDAKAEEKVLSVRFNGGIARNLSQYSLAPHQAWDIVNFDIGRGIEKRKGFWAVGSSLYGGSRDSILAVYGLKKRDGSQRLLRVAADSSNNWSDIWTGTLAAPYKTDAWLFRGGDYWFTTWRSYAFITDGYNFPWVTSGDTAVAENHSLHVPAPGEFYVEVLDDTNSTLDGTYRWAVLSFPNCDTTTELCAGLTDTARARCLSRHTGYITPEVTVHHRTVALHLFWPNIPSLIPGDTCATPLPHKFYLTRTRVNKNRLSITVQPNNFTSAAMYSDDSLFVLETIIGFPDSFAIDGNTGLTLLAYDSGQAAPGGFNLVHEYERLYGGVKQGLDSFAMSGMPKYYGADPLHAGPPFVGTAVGRYLGDTASGASGLGQYAITFIDTVLCIESDTSRNLQLEYGIGDSLVKISIQPVPSIFNNYARRIYRAVRVTNTNLGDTISALRLLCQLPETTTIFTDTFSRAGIESTLVNHPVFVKKTHFRFGGTVIWADRMYGWTGPNLYYSAKDTAKFGILDFISLSADNADAITAVVPDRNRLLVYQSNSRHEVYEDANGDFSRTSPPYVVSGVGCIAGRSMVSWRGARIYLSRFGVVYEIGNQYLEKGNQIDTIGMGIKPLLDAVCTPEEQARAVGAIFDDDKYLLCVPGHDTTFVCFLEQPGLPWAIYSPFSFKAATLYEDDDDHVLEPPTDMVFCRPGSDKVFKWGDSLTDNGQGYSATYQTGRMLVAPEKSTIEKALMVREAGGATLTVYDEDGDSLGSYIIPDSGTALQLLGATVANEVAGYQIKIVADTATDSLRIEAVDLWYRLLGIDWRDK